MVINTKIRIINLIGIIVGLFNSEKENKCVIYSHASFIFSDLKKIQANVQSRKVEMS
jgi:hypothetical protein